MLELEIQAACEVVGDLAARVMANWPCLEVRKSDHSLTFCLPTGDRLDEDLKKFEETLQAVEKSRGLEELGVNSRNLEGPDSGPDVINVGSFVLKNPDAKVKPEPCQVTITLETGNAFGTGGHPTTVISLMALEEYFNPPPGVPCRKGGRVLDAGTGSGILSIASAKMGAGRILAVDVAEEAVQVARRNAQLNDVEMEVERVAANRVKGEFDLILANLVPAVMMRSGKKLAPLLAPGGYMIVSGYPDSLTPQVVKSLTKAGMTVYKSYSRSGWGGMLLEKAPAADWVSVEEFIGVEDE